MQAPNHTPITLQRRSGVPTPRRHPRRLLIIRELQHQAALRCGGSCKGDANETSFVGMNAAYVPAQLDRRSFANLDPADADGGYYADVRISSLLDWEMAASNRYVAAIMC